MCAAKAIGLGTSRGRLGVDGEADAAGEGEVFLQYLAITVGQKVGRVARRRVAILHLWRTRKPGPFGKGAFAPPCNATSGVAVEVFGLAVIVSLYYDS